METVQDTTPEIDVYSLVKEYGFIITPKGAICCPDKSFIISVDNAVRHSTYLEKIFKKEKLLYEMRYQQLLKRHTAGKEPSINCEISISQEKGPYYVLPTPSKASSTSYIIGLEAWEKCIPGDEVFMKTLLNLNIAYQHYS